MTQYPTHRAVILTALRIEYQAVRAHLTDLKEEPHPQGTVYEKGKFVSGDQTWEVAIVEIGAGNAGAAFETERAIERFKPSVVLFVGVAGGVKDVTLGDVVAATKVYGYESGKAEATFKPRPDVGGASYALEQRARAEARKDDWLQRVRPAATMSPRVFIGPIAAGEKVIESTYSSVYEFIRLSYSDTLAVEMEGSGFLSAAHANWGVEALIIRGISDLLDAKREADASGSQALAAQHASAFAFQILAKLEDHGKAAYQEALSPVAAAAPTPPEYFIGRRGQLADLKTLLLDKDHPPSIVALQGMGGVGKTAFALQLAKEVGLDFPGGIFWGSLSQYAGSPGPILAIWGRACDQDFSPEGDPGSLADTVRNLFATRLKLTGPLLLIVDDVRADWRDSARLLASARPNGVSMIVTTREVPVAQALAARRIPMDVLNRDLACELLTTLTDGRLTLAEANRIAALCGDLPLALKLAAAIALEEGSVWLLSNLSDGARRLNVLELDDADKGSDSVRLTFDVSYLSLTQRRPETARIFRGLGVFATGVVNPAHLAGVLAQSLENNRQIETEVSNTQIQAIDDELRQLARWALVQRENRGLHGPPSYRLHPLLLQYAQERLAQSSEDRLAAQQHLSYYVKFAQRNAQPDPEAWDRLEEELPNLMRAAQHAADCHDVSALVQLEESLLHDSLFLNVRGYFKEAVDLFDISLKVQSGSGVREHKARTLNKLAYFHLRLGNYSRVEEYARQAYDLAQSLTDPAQQADSFRYLGTLYAERGKNQVAANYFQREMEIRERLGEPLRLAGTLNNLGLVEIAAGEYAAAKRHIDQAVDHSGQHELSTDLILSITNRAMLALYLGDYRNARNDYTEALRLSREIDNRAGIAQALLSIGLLQGYCDEYLLAIRNIQESLGVYRRLADGANELLALGALAEIYAVLGAHEYARRFIQDADDVLQKVNAKIALVDYLNMRGAAQHELGEYENALDSYRRMEGLAQEAEPGYFLAQSRLGLSRAYLTRDQFENWETARRYAVEALALCQKLQLAGSQPRAHAYLGQTNLLLADKTAALENCREAVRLLNLQKHIHGSKVEIYLIVVDVLEANDGGQERRHYLKRAYAHILEISERIADQSLRQSYLSAPSQRRIANMWKAIED